MERWDQEGIGINKSILIFFVTANLKLFVSSGSQISSISRIMGPLYSSLFPYSLFIHHLSIVSSISFWAISARRRIRTAWLALKLNRNVNSTGESVTAKKLTGPGFSPCEWQRVIDPNILSIDVRMTSFYCNLDRNRILIYLRNVVYELVAHEKYMISTTWLLFAHENLIKCLEM